jgi:hypothetical protein
MIRDLPEATRAKGVQLPILKASTQGEIDTAFTSLDQLHAGALVVAPDPSSAHGTASYWRWHHAMLFRRSMRGVNSSPPVA